MKNGYQPLVDGKYSCVICGKDCDEHEINLRSMECYACEEDYDDGENYDYAEDEPIYYDDEGLS